MDMSCADPCLLVAQIATYQAWLLEAFGDYVMMATTRFSTVLLVATLIGALVRRPAASLLSFAAGAGKRAPGPLGALILIIASLLVGGGQTVQAQEGSSGPRQGGGESVSINGLPATLVVGSDDHAFTVVASGLDTSLEYRLSIKVPFNDEIVGFRSDDGVSDIKEEPPPVEYRAQPPDCSTWITGSSVFYDETTYLWNLTLNACTPGDVTLTARLFEVVDGGGGDDEEVATTEHDLKVIDKPDLVRNLSLESDDESLVVRWDEPHDNGNSEIARYEVQYKRTSVSPWSSAPSVSATTTETTITGLTNGTDYDVQVRACNAAGCSEWSPSATKPPYTTPDQMAAPTLTSGNGRLTVGWSSPADGGAVITRYEVQYKRTSVSSWTSAPLVIGSARQTTITGLTNGTAYDVRVRACNAAGCTVDWSPLTRILIPTTPDQMAAPTLTSGNGRLTVGWSAPADGGSPITGYEVQYKRTSVSSWSSAPSVSATTTETTITGLTNGTEYDVEVRACNQVGCTVLWSFPTRILIPTTPDQMAAPTLTSGNGRLTVGWSAPADGGSPITGYEVQYKRTTVSSWTSAPSVSATTTETTITGLAEGTEYDVEVRAVNEGGAGDWSSTEMWPTLPGEPAISAVTSGDRTLTVRWNAPNDGGARITSYDVQRRSGGGNWSLIRGAWSTGDGSREYEITGLAEGTEYDVEVRAVNEGGAGDWSSTEMWPTLPGEPAISAVTPGDRTLTVRWNAPNDGGARITSYDVRHVLTSGNEMVEANWTLEEDAWTVGDLTYEISGLTNGEEYDVQVRAVNDAGGGAWTASTTEAPMGVLSTPDQTAAPALTPGDQSLTVAWSTPASNGGAVITAYDVRHILTSEDETVEANWTLEEDAWTAGALTYEISGLTNGMSYDVQVRAVNDAGDGAWSATAMGTPRTTPDQTAAPTLTPGDQSLTVTWAATGNGGSVITVYDVRHILTSGDETVDGNWTLEEDAWTAGALTYEISGLTNGEGYDVQVRAVNDAGDGAWSATATGTPRTTPDQTAAPTLTPGDQSLTVTWAAPGNGGSVITAYDVRHILTSEDETVDANWTLEEDAWTAGALTYEISGLTNGEGYDVQVRAVNAAGDGAWSPSVAGAPLAGTTTPEQTSAPTLTPGDGRLTVTWAVTGNGGSVITAYDVRHILTSGDETVDGNWTLEEDAWTAGDLTYGITGLTNGEGYDVQVRAVNAAGDGAWSATAMGMPRTTPEQTSAPTLTPGDGSLTVTWVATGNGGSVITAYDVRHILASGDEAVDANWTLEEDAWTAGALTYEVSGLTNGEGYNVQVRAVNAAGDGAWSAIAMGTPRTTPEEMSAPTLTPGDGSLTVTWAAPDNGGSVITAYDVRHILTSGDEAVDGNWTLEEDAWTAGALTYEVTGLTNGEGYDVQVRAVNAAGDGAWSAIAMGTPRTTPEEMSAPTLTPGDGSLTVTWAAPDNGGSVITAYDVRHILTSGDETVDGNWTLEEDAWTAGALTYGITGLTNGEGYDVQVRAVNAAGDGAWSASATDAPTEPPAQPTGFTATAGNTQVWLSWDDPGDATITKWQYGITEGSGQEEMRDVPQSSASTTAYRVTGLNNGSRYSFRVRAVNAAGDGPHTMPQVVTPMAALPAKPTGFTATPGDAQVTLSWDDPLDASITAHEYTSDGGANWAGIPASASGEANATSYTVGGLTNGLEYTFAVRAVNDSGAGPESDDIAVAPSPYPAQPTGLIAIAGAGQATLYWDDASDPAITEYEYTSDGGVNWTGIPDSAPGEANATSYTVGGLTNGLEHTFAVRAVNVNGAGPESDSAAATPHPAKPAGFAAIAGDGQATLRWDDPSDASITRYQYRQEGSGGWTDISGSGAGTTSHTVGGLTNGLEYAFQVRSVSGNVHGPASDLAAATPSLYPAKPMGLIAIAGDGQASLRWDDPGDPAITEYQYTLDGGANWTGIPDSAPGEANATSYTVGDLTNGLEYTFHIRAVNTNGAGPESDDIAVAPSPYPAQPTGLIAIAGAGQATLSWDDSLDASITEYEYTLDGGANWTGIPDSAPGEANATSYTVGGLTNGLEHTFAVRAVNANGAGPESDSAAATPHPAKPTGFTAIAGDSQVTLRWDDPGDPAITEYEYTSDGGANWTGIPDSAPGEANATSYTVGSLTNGLEYAFHIRAVSGNVHSLESDSAAATPSSYPAQPTGLIAIAGAGQATLYWDDPSDPAITEYEYTSDGGANWAGIPDSAPGEANATSYTVGDLTNGLEYTFHIRAVNANGVGPESDSAAATPHPAKPAGFAAIAGDGQVTLRWDDPSDASITRYQYRQEGSGGWQDIPGSGADTTSHTVGGLTNGLEYVFQVRSVSGNVHGPASDLAAATPALTEPTKPTGLAAAEGNAQVTLSWDDPFDGTITKHQYTLDGGANWTDIPDSAPGEANATSYTVGGLTNGLEYTFAIRAVNAVGDSLASDSVMATPTYPPGGPTGLRATPGDGQATLNWDNPYDGTITKYQYRQREISGEFGEWMDIPGSGASTVSYTVTDLTNGVRHVFAIRAVNVSGHSNSSPFAIVTPAASQGARGSSDTSVATHPAQPMGLTATLVDGRVTLSWDDSGDPAITKYQYNVRCGGSWGAWRDIPGSRADTTSHTVTDLADGAECAFTIRAVNADGNSAPAGAASATPTSGEEGLSG